MFHGTPLPCENGVYPNCCLNRKYDDKPREIVGYPLIFQTIPYFCWLEIPRSPNWLLIAFMSYYHIISYDIFTTSCINISKSVHIPLDPRSLVALISQLLLILYMAYDAICHRCHAVPRQFCLLLFNPPWTRSCTLYHKAWKNWGYKLS